jgi:pimeloyl-ACP methyl ester carboxylesterase
MLDLMTGGNGSTIVEATMPSCRKKAIIPGAGHWIQQERPREINELLVEFAKGV